MVKTKDRGKKKNTLDKRGGVALEEMSLRHFFELKMKLNKKGISLDRIIDNWPNQK